MLQITTPGVVQEEVVDEDYRVNETLFKYLLDDLCYIDVKRITPIEADLVREMWLSDLYAKQDEYDGVEEYTEIGHVVNLLAGLQNIKLPELLVNEAERKLYHKPEGGFLYYAKKQTAKFGSFEEMEQFHRKYMLLFNNKKVLRKKGVIEGPKMTFQPQLNEKSIKISQAKLG